MNSFQARMNSLQSNFMWNEFIPSQNEIILSQNNGNDNSDGDNDSHNDDYNDGDFPFFIINHMLSGTPPEKKQ